MKKLFVEELECRNLLSVAGVGHLASHGFESNRVDAEPSQSLVDFGGRDRLINDFNPGSARNDMRSGGFNFNTGVSTVEVTIEIVIITPAQTAESSSVVDGPVFRSSAIRQATGSPLNLPEASVSLPLASAVLNSPRSTGEASDVAALLAAENGSTNLTSADPSTASAANRTGAQLAGRTDVVLVSAVGRNIDSAPFAASSGIAAAGPGSGLDGSTGPGPFLPPSPWRLPALQLPQSALAQSIQAGLASLPQFADMVNGISTVSLGHIEQGIASFLASLDPAPIAAMPGNSADFYPWMLAGVVTAVACELARRQLKKPALTNPFELATLPLAPWETPEEQENGRRTAR